MPLLNRHTFSPAYIMPLAVLLAGLCCILQTWHAGPGDFGNYYFGSLFLREGLLEPGIFDSIHVFNALVAERYTGDFFLNYIPVPPFSALFYLPFTWFGPETARLLFNCFGLLLFSLCLHFLIRKEQLNGRLLFLSLLIMVPAIYYNISQGQSYLLISSILIAAYLLAEAKHFVLAGCCLALAISLKLFPAFMLLYFVFRRDYRTFACALVAVAVLGVLTFLVIPGNYVGHYITDIMPRLFDNDVIGRMEIKNQSIHAWLERTITARELVPNWSIPLAEGIFNACLIYFTWTKRRENALLFFGLCLLCLQLFNRYNPSYSFLLLSPLFLVLPGAQMPAPRKIILLLLLLAAALLPLLPGSGFARIFLMLLAFGILVIPPTLPLHQPILLPGLILFFVSARILRYETPPAGTYYHIQNSKGVLYDINLSADSLVLYSCMGAKDHREAFLLSDQAHLVPGTQLQLARAKTATKKVMLPHRLLYLSDEEQPPGFYKLRSISFHE